MTPMMEARAVKNPDEHECMRIVGAIGDAAHWERLDPPPIRLKLRLARSACADSAAKLRHGFAFARQPRQLVLRCADSTCNWPSRVRACFAKMSRISCVRSSTRHGSAASRLRSCVGERSWSNSTRSASVEAATPASSSALPEPISIAGSSFARCCISTAATSRPRSTPARETPPRLRGVQIGKRRLRSLSRRGRQGTSGHTRPARQLRRAGILSLNAFGFRARPLTQPLHGRRMAAP